jgi:glycosyltransferase involved in cell wall biosynthesis
MYKHDSINMARNQRSAEPELSALGLTRNPTDLMPDKKSVTFAPSAVQPSPLFSFIVPAHNEETELPGTLRAIRQAAESAGNPYEILVVDDSSTDATAAIAREFGVRLISVQYRQIAAARNAGARAARGEVLFFVDADTQIGPVHVTNAFRSLTNGNSGGSARMKMDGEIPFVARVFFALFATIYFGSNLGAGAFLFTRKETFEAVGGFDEQYFAAEETYFSMAVKKFGPFKILPEPVVTSGRKVRMHDSWHVLRQLLGLMLCGPRALRSRKRLGLWYDGKREQKPA